jgi:hypothetical protein
MAANIEDETRPQTLRSSAGFNASTNSHWRSTMRLKALRPALLARALGHGVPQLIVLLLICMAEIALAQANPTSPVVLEQVISHEDPKFLCAQARMSVGGDGFVYLASGVHEAGNDGSYVLRVARDGTQRLGGDVEKDSLQNATANAHGVIATANSHFNHSVNLYDPNFHPLGSCSEFTNNDKPGVDYGSPAMVVAGPSGDFYGLEAPRFRVLRMSPTGKVIQGYQYPEEWKNITEFRLCEDRQTLYLRTPDGTAHAVGFDGKTQWEQRLPGVWDVDDKGVVYSLGGNSSVVKRWSAIGRALPDIRLQTGGLAPSGQLPATGLCVWKGELLLKRAHPSELFAVYDLTSGAQKNVVFSDHETLRVTYPGRLWTAGQSMSCKLELEGNGQPEWHFWAAILGDDDWRELKWQDGQLQVPADMAGLYQLKVTAGTTHENAGGYLLRDMVEVRPPGSVGTISVWTPHNRIWFGQGEEINIAAALRGPAPTATVSLELTQANHGDVKLFTTELRLDPAGKAAVKIPASLTNTLAPGRYALRAVAPNYCCPVQPLLLGPGMQAVSPFRVSLFGDYDNAVKDAGLWDFPDEGNRWIHRAQMLGINQFVERIFAQRVALSFLGNDNEVLLKAWRDRLAADAVGVAPEKVDFGFSHYHTIGAFGAMGMREMLILAGMDASLPLGTHFPWNGPIDKAPITPYTRALTALPGFHGWDWAANWWANDDARFTSPEQKKAYEVAMKLADQTGKWNPLFDTVGDRAIGWQVNAQQTFKDELAKTAPTLATASAGPYRRPEVYPPTSFSNVDEVSLHYQAEQITTPDWTPHAVDYMRRPGKPAWMNPELWNDSGTGEQILPMSWLAMMRGVDGIGCSGNMPNWGAQPNDPRSGYAGTVSVFRALNRFANQYGPWLTTLENVDQVAIIVSPRHVKVDRFDGLGGRYFNRLFEAYQSLLYAHRTATFLYPEDATPERIRQFRAIFVVGQTFEFEPSVANILKQAQSLQLPIYADGTCRPEFVKGDTKLPLSFDSFEKIPAFNAPTAYLECSKLFLKNGSLLDRALASNPPLLKVDQPQVLVSAQRSGAARFYWVVNNTISPLEPGLLWRVSVGMATLQPVVAHVTLPIQPGEVAYDLFTGRRVEAQTTADLRYTSARLYAVLPEAITSLQLEAPSNLEPGQTIQYKARVPRLDAKLPMRLRLIDKTGALLAERFTTTGQGSITVPINAATPVQLEARELISGQTASTGGRAGDGYQVPASWFGPRLRDVAVSNDGKTALLNAFEWGRNLYAVDTQTGKLRGTGNVGGHFAYEPQACGAGFLVQGFDLLSAEGYHAYQITSDGLVTRRFAQVGMPSRLTGWCWGLVDHPTSFAAANDGAWFASAGNLGLCVWSADGKRLWFQDSSTSSRQIRLVARLNHDSLLVAQGMNLTAHEVRTGRKLWNVALDNAGEILSLNVSETSGTIVARTSARSGRIYVIRAGKILGVISSSADDVAVTPDGTALGLTTGRQLLWYASDGSLLWAFAGDDTLRFPRVSHDGQRVIVSSELGTAYCFNAQGQMQWQRDMQAIAAPAFLANDDVLLASWMGTVTRLDSRGQVIWTTHLGNDESPAALGQTTRPAAETVSTIRATAWDNALPKPLALTPNLVAADNVIVQAKLGTRAVALQNPAAILFDGHGSAPPKPWLEWETVGTIDSGWMGSFSLEIDAFRRLLRIKAITLVEDPAHPESWLRDAKLEYWDSAKSAWVFAEYLTSDAPVHSHLLVHPIEAVKIRITRPDTAGWPVGNLRLAQIVLHGQSLGASHPDVIANRPVAVLYDGRDSDLATLVGASFVRGDAFSGGSYLRVEADRFIHPSYQGPFGHAIPNWDFKIVENPQKPGEYRWLQFAYKALAPQTRGVTLRIGQEWPGGGIIADMGEPFKLDEGVWVRKHIPDQSSSDGLTGKLSTEWTVVRLDLWSALRESKQWAQAKEKPFCIRCIDMGAVGGPAGFDQILLGRTALDLSAVKPTKRE